MTDPSPDPPRGGPGPNSHLRDGETPARELPSSCQARAACSSAGDPVRVDLIWRDPVTGAELDLDLLAAPGLVHRLLEDGFRGSRRGPGGGPRDGGKDEGGGGSRAA
ncbi:MAG: hypothetical protein AAFZ87_06900 [Planctomycetota bacterium]